MWNIRNGKLSEIEGFKVDLLNRNDVTMVLLAHHVHLVDAISSVDHHPYSTANDATDLLLLSSQRC